MPLDEPKKVYKARYFLDIRNELCHPCAMRLLGNDEDDVDALDGVNYSDTSCTECVAIAAGVHPELRRKNEQKRNPRRSKGK